mmetsp:Transcript_22622/g.49644  ORF Transcript_22622/g.49644 Transcript_22622/m.49644 type:complete len:200 (+) Transcript_22622:1042-1641(+)
MQRVARDCTALQSAGAGAAAAASKQLATASESSCGTCDRRVFTTAPFASALINTRRPCRASSLGAAEASSSSLRKGPATKSTLQAQLHLATAEDTSSVPLTSSLRNAEDSRSLLRMALSHFGAFITSTIPSQREALSLASASSKRSRRTGTNASTKPPLLSSLSCNCAAARPAAFALCNSPLANSSTTCSTRVGRSSFN